MQTPQDGIFGWLSENHYFLEYGLRGGMGAEEAISALQKIARLPGKDGPALVMGFGSRLWKKLASPAVPRLLRPFSIIKGRRGKSAPGIQQDMWLHGGTAGELFDLAMQTQGMLGPSANLFQEIAGMTYRGGRDLTGFGMARPIQEVPRQKRIALMPMGKKGEGGSYILAMRWVHELKAFAALPLKNKEAVIGRTKEKDVELKGASKRPDAHISRMEIEVDGNELRIYRRGIPLWHPEGNGPEYPGVFRRSKPVFHDVEQHVRAGEDRLEDRLTDFTRAVSGSYFFVPSKETLRNLMG